MGEGHLRKRGTDGLKSSINRQKLIKSKGLRANKVAQKKEKKKILCLVKNPISVPFTDLIFKPFNADYLTLQLIFLSL